MYKPVKRGEDELLVEEVFDEMMLFDRKRLKVHALNPTAVFVWQLCDGEHTTADLSERVSQKYNLEPNQAAAVVELSLNRLAKAHLLEGKASDAATSLNRRQVIKGLGVAAVLLPVVKSLVAPPHVVAQSFLLQCGAPAAGYGKCDQTSAAPNNCCCCQLAANPGGNATISCQNINGCNTPPGSFCFMNAQPVSDCPGF
ncbi:MAG: hypothetical protein ETSY2_34145 [Candidatus Entotheonella gemina]|uniref:PqqD family protein n=1 Tax=Candidatus Entotheonella gemina TaxID=1429439 RepID=W4LYB6_9BACT|nr:MAG: hypothetical protein ETSY2_34145 [Candidatus Entotheonella gemina]